MRKTILARLLGATLPQTHAAVFPINLERRFTAYFGARGGDKSWDHRFWFDEAARIDPNAWLSAAQIKGIRGLWRKGDQSTVSTMPADDAIWKPLTREEILSDIKKLVA